MRVDQTLFHNSTMKWFQNRFQVRVGVVGTVKANDAGPIDIFDTLVVRQES